MCEYTYIHIIIRVHTVIYMYESVRVYTCMIFVYMCHPLYFGRICNIFTINCCIYSLYKETFLKVIDIETLWIRNLPR